MVSGYHALTEKEKQTLRLLLDGHDAKSMARHLELSVHTINERLRDARRKLGVSSSREAARLLRQAEVAAPETLGDMSFRGAGPVATDQRSSQPSVEPRSTRPAAWAVGGLAMIALIAAMLALSPAEISTPTGQASDATARSPAAESAITRAARHCLELVDAGKRHESLAATGGSFKTLNTLAAWRSASEQARVPLGRVLSRTLLEEQDIPAPPRGYRVVRFRTDFANKSGATETLSLDREGDSWKVVGIYIE